MVHGFMSAPARRHTKKAPEGASSAETLNLLAEHDGVREVCYLAGLLLARSKSQELARCKGLSELVEVSALVKGQVDYRELARWALNLVLEPDPDVAEVLVLAALGNSASRCAGLKWI